MLTLTKPAQETVETECIISEMKKLRTFMADAKEAASKVAVAQAFVAPKKFVRREQVVQLQAKSK